MLIEKIPFEEKWEKERSQGLIGYYKKHVYAILALFIGVAAGDSIANRRFRFEFLIIELIVICLLPAVSWVMNEMHYKSLKKSTE